MSFIRHLRVATAIAAFSIVAVSPALAQGKGNGKGKAKQQDRAAAVQQRAPERERPTLQLRTSGTESRTTLPNRADARSTNRADVRSTSRSDDRYDDRYHDRYDDRYDDRYEDGRRQRVPPGWCKGKGNPHNTPENCGYSRSRDYDYDDDDRRYGGSGSYAQAHADFHRNLDRKYADLASRRRSDPIYQLRLRADKASEHQRWHERTGTRH